MIGHPSFVQQTFKEPVHTLFRTSYDESRQFIQGDSSCAGSERPNSKRASHGRARGMLLAKLVFLASVGKAEKTDRCHERNFKFTTTTSASMAFD
jgi:hypothetical protein